MHEFTPSHLAVASHGYTACLKNGAHFVDAWGNRVRGTAYLPAVQCGRVTLCDLLACTPREREVALRERARGLRVACLVPSKKAVR